MNGESRARLLSLRGERIKEKKNETFLLRLNESEFLFEMQC